MQLLLIEVTNRNAIKTLQSLHDKQFIRITEDAEMNSPSLPGSSLSLKAFKNWINKAELSEAVSLNQAHRKWAAKRKKLLKASK